MRDGGLQCVQLHLQGRKLPGEGLLAYCGDLFEGLEVFEQMAFELGEGVRHAKVFLWGLQDGLEMTTNVRGGRPG